MIPLPRNALVWAAAAAAAVSLGAAAIPLARHLAGDSGPPPQQPRDARRALAETSLDSILAWSPFGRPEPPAEAPPPAAPSLDLTLNGVVIAADPGQSKASVTGASLPQRSYAIGEEIAPGVALAEVFADHVVLMADGRRQLLAFPQMSDVAPPPAAEPAPEPVPAAASVGEGVAAFRERLRADPQQMLAELGVIVTDKGYRITDGAPSVVLLAGLQPDDLVTSVNGQQVGNIEQDINLFDDVTASGRVTMQIVRNGEPMEVSFQLK